MPEAPQPFALVTSAAGKMYQYPPPVLAITPRELNFVDVPVRTSSQQHVQVYNAGRGALEVTPVELVGEDFHIPALKETVTVPPMEHSGFGVWFAPPEVCERTGELVFTSNDPDKPLTKIRLHGIGVPWLSASPSWLHYGNLDVDEWRTLTAVITNETHFAFFVAEISVDLQAAQAEFKPTTKPHEVPFPLRPGESFKLFVSARPRAKGEQNAYMKVLCKYETTFPDPDPSIKPETTFSFSLRLRVIGV